MALTLVNASGIRVFMGTLTDGADIHAALAETAQHLNIGAATVDLLGGLTEVELSEYDFATHTRKPPLTFIRPLEIVAGHGTISMLNDAPHVHLHLLLTFRDEAAPNGIAIIGGHVMRALAFAVEFTLTIYDGAPMRRALHTGTGLQLWQ